MTYIKYLLPNTTFFTAIPDGIDYLSSLFSIEKTRHEIINVPDAEMTKANKYLKKMSSRLAKNAKKIRCETI